MKIVAALSGGVDSSVAAQRLVKEGHEVIGLFMRLTEGEGSSCCNIRTGQTARRVADELKIPFMAVDYSESFKKNVIDHALDNLNNGLTPNPCVECNRKVKFEELLGQAKRMGAQALATGHYSKIFKNKNSYEMHEADSQEKDQSYFLWPTLENSLKEIIFPLGDVEDKAIVREEALQGGLPTAETPESQDLCFAPEGLTKFLGKEDPGDLLDLKGRVIGQHKGHFTVTLGQRRGLGGVALGKPVYVVKKDHKTNTVTVGDKDSFSKREVCLTRVNWLSDPEKFSKKVSGRIRYRGKKRDIKKISNNKIIFEDPMTVAPGQSVVVYYGTRVIGGGVAV